MPESKPKGIKYTNMNKTEQILLKNTTEKELGTSRGNIRNSFITTFCRLVKYVRIYLFQPAKHYIFSDYLL